VFAAGVTTRLLCRLRCAGEWRGLPGLLIRIEWFAMGVLEREGLDEAAELFVVLVLHGGQKNWADSCGRSDRDKHSAWYDLEQVPQQRRLSGF
jgi:hypothetical protein